ncbi:MAG: sigma-70 family RNA polymerase sigma factor [Planctomycetia bacterium]|nr:sigma-70 family RNA polymerase sigma factor [Planctomycetia bacterium]
MTPADTALWTSWRERRDGRAFEELVAPHLVFAAAFAHRLGCRGADVDDVVQRALVALVSDRDGKAARVGVRAWLARGVLQETRMAARAARRRAVHEHGAAALRAGDARPAPPPVEVRDDVERALAALAPDDRQLVELRFLHDLEYREVAFVTGRSALACRLRVHRALTRLRATLGKAAPLLVASIALPALAPSAQAAVPAAIAAADGAGPVAGWVGGGWVMGTSGKLAAAVGAALLIGGGVWWVAGRGPADGDAGTQPASPVREARAPSAGAPTELAATGRASRPGEGTSVVASGDEGSAATRAVPLDAPISKGKGSVAGTLRFEDGTPLAGVTVALTIAPDQAEAVSAVTDAEGRFHLHDTWVGDRPLTLVEADGTVLILRNVAMRPDERVTVDATVARGVTLAGVVRDRETGTPIGGAAVTLRRRGTHTGNMMQAGYGGARSDAHGRFRFRFVPAGPASIAVVAAGREATIRVVEVGASDVDVALSLVAARALVVRYEPCPKEAVGERMAWTVQGPLTSSDQLSYGSRGARDGVAVPADGEFRLDAPPPGRYALTLYGTATLPRFQTEFDVTAEEVPVIRVPVAPGGRVVGTLLDAAGRPVVGRRLAVGPLTSEPTDVDGKFGVGRVPTGIQPVAMKIGYCGLHLGSVDVAADRETLLAVRLPGAASFKAAIDAAPDGAWLVLTDAQGATVVDGPVEHRAVVALTGLPAGTHRLRLKGDACDDFDREVRLEDGATLDLGTIGPRSRPVVPVRVTMPAGVERPALIVVFEPRRMPEVAGEILYPVGRIEFGEQGVGRLTGLSAGRHRVLLQAGGSMSQKDLTEVELDVREGITTPIEITIKPW